MARKFVVGIDLLQNELINARVVNIGTAPSTPVEGQIYFNNTVGNKTLFFYNGTDWVPASGSAEVIQDTTNSMLIAGTGLDKTYDDDAGTLTLDIDSTVTTNSGTQTLTNKSISLTTNTLTGTLAEFNTALSGDDFVSLTGAETLTNKTLTSPTVSGLYISDSAFVVEGTANDHETTVTFTDPTEDRTITIPNNSGTVILDSNTVNSLTAPAASFSMNNQKITNLATPTDASDAATKGYVDSTAIGLDVKLSVRAATTANIDLTTDLENGDALDGVTLATGNRVLVKNQTDETQNGIYVVAASGAAARSEDANSDAEVTAGLFTFVEEGTVNGNTGFVLTSDNPITLGSTSLVFSQFSGVGTFTAAAGLTLTGTAFSVDVTPTSGNASLTNTGGAVEVKVNTNDGLEVTENGLGINNGTGLTFDSGALVFDTANGYGVRKLAFNVGDGSATSIAVTHSLGTKDVTVHIYENASPYAQVEADVEHTDTNNTTVKFAVAPTSNQYRVVIVG
jgi:hypothetical protein